MRRLAWSELAKPTVGTSCDAPPMQFLCNLNFEQRNIDDNIKEPIRK